MSFIYIKKSSGPRMKPWGTPVSSVWALSNFEWYLARYVKLVAHAPGMSETFSPSPGVSDADMHHGTCVTHVPWCMPGWLICGFLWSRWWGKFSYVFCIFSCDKAAQRTLQSVRLSVCYTFFTLFPSSYHHEIFRSCYQWQNWCPCKRSRSEVKVTKIKTQHSRFWTATPVWIHIWSCNDAQSLMLLRRGALLFWRSSVKFQGHTAKQNRRFWPKLCVSR